MSRILVIAPHADDETLGLGATIAKHSSMGDEVFVSVLTGHGVNPHPLFKKEGWDIVRKEARDAMDVLGVKEIIFSELPAALLSTEPTHIINKEVFAVLEKVRPNIIYMPFINDLHKDHREICYALQVAIRPISELGRGVKEVYMYETLSETHWNIDTVEGAFVPNVFTDVTDFLHIKLKAFSKYKSQIKDFPNPRSLEGLEALAKFRGSICGLFAAEAFVMTRKIN